MPLLAENATNVSQLAEFVKQNVDLHDEAKNDEPFCHHENEVSGVGTAEIDFSLLLNVKWIGNVLDVVECGVEAGKLCIVKLPRHYYYMSSVLKIPNVQ